MNFIKVLIILLFMLFNIIVYPFYIAASIFIHIMLCTTIIYIIQYFNGILVLTSRHI